MDELYNRAAIYCIGNALNLSESAELIHEKGNTGLASSLLVLAIEEVAKGHHYRSMAEGATTTDVKKLGKTWVYSPKVPYTHELKHMFAGAGGIVDPFMKVLNENKKDIDAMIESLGIPDDLQSFLTSENEEKSRQIYEKFFGSNDELQKKSDELKYLIKNMERIKELGFYIDLKEGKVIGPKDVLEDDYKRLKSHLDELFLHYGASIVGNIKPSSRELSKKVLDELAKRQKIPSMGKYKHKRETKE